MDAIAESKIAVLDLASHYDEVSTFVHEKINPEFEEIGLNLTKFLIENISLPEEVEKVLDKRSSMGIVGNLGSYAQFQAANAMEKAAENPSGGGIMGAGLGVGLGAGMAGQMTGVFQQNKFDGNHSSGEVPPAIPMVVQYFLALNGVQEGPFRIEQLQGEVKSGKLLAETLVWKAGMENWKEAREIEELKSLFNAMPPPIPGVQ